MAEKNAKVAKSSPEKAGSNLLSGIFLQHQSSAWGVHNSMPHSSGPCSNQYVVQPVMQTMQRLFFPSAFNVQSLCFTLCSKSKSGNKWNNKLAEFPTKEYFIRYPTYTSKEMGVLRKIQAPKEPCLRERSKLRRLMEKMSLCLKSAWDGRTG